MNDITDRLRTFVACEGGDLADVEEAADTIDRLRAALADLTIERDILRRDNDNMRAERGRLRALVEAVRGANAAASGDTFHLLTEAQRLAWDRLMAALGE